MKKTPTTEQSNVINHDNSCVVVAAPGSGKTYTISEKIRGILKDLPQYKGVIAISYTNKASVELQHRCIGDGLDKKGSFFGTIHKFFISEIIIPFGKMVFGPPAEEFEIVKREVLSDEWKIKLNALPEIHKYEDITEGHVDAFKGLYQEGVIVLESIGFLALCVFKSSVACRNYIKARYSHIFVDEYQDSKRDQHELFLELHQLGIKAIAVGDIKQAIFSLPECIKELNNNDEFTGFKLSLNHRCHRSINNYAWYFYTGEDLRGENPAEDADLRVFEKQVTGSEVDIAKWLNVAIPQYMKKFGVQDRNQVAVLVHQNIKFDVLAEGLEIDYKVSRKVPLSERTDVPSGLFNRILEHLASDQVSRYEIIEEFIRRDHQPIRAHKADKLIKDLKGKRDDGEVMIDHIDLFKELCKQLLPYEDQSEAIEVLKTSLNDDPSLERYMPAKKDQVNIMTLHKSKGLEFDIVFHLDLYKWGLPAKKIVDKSTNPWTTEFFRLQQDGSLHFVGITRAKQCVVLCTSTKRHKKKYQATEIEVKAGNPSEFLRWRQNPELQEMRDNSPF
ncbi:ATP-dependent helicase [Pontibacter sp. G13]|uniref:ATP-dependent helicase n=1 Tax=Pontibacter sp. G13 TaxID=3074898 RepID=UPI00288A8147|nr:ATP-dependent helicase [Pontibacter sp. G13]WNJ20339.1 ATP-dependent helicase [Pontibacter sp. G13]